MSKIFSLDSSEAKYIIKSFHLRIFFLYFAKEINKIEKL